MHPTLLLPAPHRIVSGVKIRYEDSLVALQHLLHHRSLPCFRQSENDVLPVGEHPDIMIYASDAEPRLVNMNKRTLPQSLEENRTRPAVILREVVNEVDDGRFCRPLAEQVFHSLGDDPIWQTENDALVHRPGSKAVPEKVST